MPDKEFTPEEGTVILKSAEVAELCPDCAQLMERAGIEEIKLNKLYGELDEVILKAKASVSDDKGDKKQHIGFEDPGFYDRCVKMMKGRKGVQNPEGLCAKIHRKALGYWPGAERSKDFSKKKAKKNASPVGKSQTQQAADAIASVIAKSMKK